MTLRKTLFVALLLAVVVLPATSNATITRVIGLGGEDANFILRDAYNSSVWPQLVKHYGMQSGMEFYTHDGWDLQKAYVNYDFGTESSVLQFALDKLNHRNYGMLAGNELSDLDNVPGGYNKLNITYGRPMGDDMLIGVNLHWAGKSLKTNEDGGDFDDSYSEIGLMLGLTAMEEKLDVSLGFRTGGYTVDHGGATLAEADGASDIMLAGRYWHEASETYSIIPSLALGMHTDNTKMGDASNEYGVTAFRLGVGNNWTPKENLLVISELGLRSISETMKPDGGEETSDSEMDIFWRIGVESEIFPWLWGRFGAERDWVGATWESVVGQPEWSSSITSTYVGATTRWNRFQADLLVHPSFFGYGPNFVSGYTDMIFTRASVKINFDKE
ncbi:hypothetical protein HUU59_08730 [bacterium]|nr:hypothetical protein [bacterium]